MLNWHLADDRGLTITEFHIPINISDIRAERRQVYNYASQIMFLVHI